MYTKGGRRWSRGLMRSGARFCDTRQVNILQPQTGRAFGGRGGRVGAWFRSLHTAGAPRSPLSKWAWIADVLLAIVLAAATLEAMRHHGGPGTVIKPFTRVPAPPGPPFPLPQGRDAAYYDRFQFAVAALMVIPLALRRRYPVSAMWSVVIAAVILHARVPSDDASVTTFIACVLVAYSAVMYSPYQTLAITSILGAAAVLGAFHDWLVPNISAGFVPVIMLLVVGLAANAVSGWKQRIRTLEAEQAAATKSAVELERARIARELHDVLTHNVSVMLVQAGAARKVMNTAPELAHEALLAVEAGGRAAMTELRQVMGLLTMNPDNPDDAADLTPQPGLAQLDELVAHVRDAGVNVSVTTSGSPMTLSPGADLAAYRVVQEALTNAVKHAAGSSISVSIGYSSNTVTVDVTDTGGVSTASAESGNGRGLRGLRDRLALYDGTLNAGRRPTGGYRVTAQIPVAQLPAAQS